MIRQCIRAFVATAVLVSASLQAQTLTATVYDSHFPAKEAEGGESWNGISVAEDGTVYYVLSSPVYNVPARMYSFDPKTKKITELANLNDAVGQGNGKAVAQGKSHVSFVEDHGKLYFSTHLGYYNHVDGRETTGSAPEGYAPYPGGHFMMFDEKTGKFTSLAQAPRGEGIIAFAMDTERQRLYGITWPTGHFLRYDLKTKQMKDLGTLFHGGEEGTVGDTYRSICRRIVIDPRDGSAYFSTGDGALHRYDFATDAIADVPGISLKTDYFGQMDPAQHGMAYNWRAAVWVPGQNAIYGVNGRSGYLFRVDPKARTMKVLARLTSVPSQQTGMYDKFAYGYLGFVLGADGHTLYYLTGSPLPASDRSARSRSAEGMHLVTYDIAGGKYVDHGEIVLDNGDRALASQSLAVGKDGEVYSLTYVWRNGIRGIELISFHP